MTSIPVRLMVSEPDSQSTIPATVSPNQLITELNEELFPQHANSALIKWIYFGRTLDTSIPSTIAPDSVIHM